MTTQELKQLSEETFFDNNAGGIRPAEHRYFNEQLIEAIEAIEAKLLSIDLTSTIPVKTGEIFEGKPVYRIAKNTSGGSVEFNVSPYVMDKYWLDPQSFVLDANGELVNGTSFPLFLCGTQTAGKVTVNRNGVISGTAYIALKYTTI